LRQDVWSSEAWLSKHMASLILVRNVVGELQRKRTLAASRGFLAAARLSCITTAAHLPTIITSVSLSVYWLPQITCTANQIAHLYAFRWWYFLSSMTLINNVSIT